MASRKFFAKYISCFPEIGALFWVKLPHPSANKIMTGSSVGYIDKTGYKRFTLFGKKHSVHRVVWLFEHGTQADGPIDHIDGNKLNNKISNLRIASNRSNQLNRKVHREGKLAGAIFIKSRHHWISRIMVSKKRLYLGSFPTAKAANTAYKKALESL